MSWRKQNVNVFHTLYEDINYYFIQNKQYFERGHIYGDFDDGERFAFFTMAVKNLFLSNTYIQISFTCTIGKGMLPCLIKIDDHSEENMVMLNLSLPSTIQLFKV